MFFLVGEIMNGDTLFLNACNNHITFAAKQNLLKRMA